MELRAFFDVHKEMVYNPGGVMLDMTGKADVAKSVGGECDITEDDLGGNLRHNGEDGGGDLHLNKEQAIEISFLISERMRVRMGILPLIATGENGKGP